jgi:hypothetical protein
LRVASLVIGDAIRRGGLALDGPVGAAILAHRPDAAGLVFQQGQMGAQGFGRRAGQRRALTGAPALMPELLSSRSLPQVVCPTMGVLRRLRLIT